MSDEDVKVQLARIEERQIAITDRLDTMANGIEARVLVEMRGYVKGQVDSLLDHFDGKAVRRWLFILAFFVALNWAGLVLLLAQYGIRLPGLPIVP